MHKISLAQKQVLNVNLLNNINVGKGGSFFPFPVLFSPKKCERQFATLCKASPSIKEQQADGNKDKFSFSILKTALAPRFSHVAKMSTSDAMRSTKNDSPQKKDFSFDALGAWDHRIDLPILMEASIKHGAPIPLIQASHVGCSSILGNRTYQEDRYVVENLPNNILCAAVFDGHGGAECAEYCAHNLKSVLLEELEQHKDLEAVLHHAFLKLHTGYAQWTQTHNAGHRSGSTAAVSLLRAGVELAVGHAGDSRVILCRLGGSRDLTKDHCPSLISEKDRIEKSGGSVSVDNIGRHMVNEALSMSRSIGDLHLKKYGVIALPDTRTMRIKHGKDAFLLLITDGINFVLQSKEACDIINQAEDPYHAAKLLTEQAQSMSSEDNMTALVVPYGSWGKYTKSASMFYDFGIGRDMNKSSRFG
ncbi:Protein phosphatase 1K, mitochondrial [Chionoecetes opilio]|uniref:Protein phosphatase 1K, mitochondrial n=1 Tax=Chionoecetes opilio TaxID=41210 RepID=A0A8J5D152_CHIOP|nr:Protein phosphatase 1K, mitochondrial [Chionoecetes opilio]